MAMAPNGTNEPSSSPTSVNGNASGSQEGPYPLLDLLKSFLKSQETRTSLMNELESAFKAHLRDPFGQTAERIAREAEQNRDRDTEKHEHVHHAHGGTNGVNGQDADGTSSNTTSQRTPDSCLAELSSNLPSNSSNLEDRPPGEEELTSIIRITTLGLLEVREEIKIVMDRMVVDDDDLSRSSEVSQRRREELKNAMKDVEVKESEKLEQTIQRDQLRRIAVIQGRTRPGEADQSGREEREDEREISENDFEPAIKGADERILSLQSEITELVQEIRAEIMELQVV